MPKGRKRDLVAIRTRLNEDLPALCDTVMALLQKNPKVAAKHIANDLLKTGTLTKRERLPTWHKLVEILDPLQVAAPAPAVAAPTATVAVSTVAAPTASVVVDDVSAPAVAAPEVGALWAPPSSDAVVDVPEVGALWVGEQSPPPSPVADVII